MMTGRTAATAGRIDDDPPGPGSAVCGPSSSYGEAMRGPADRRRMLRAAVALAALGGGVLIGPAAADPARSDPVGQPVEGSDTLASAPTLTAGQYTDTLPSSGAANLYTLERATAGSTIWVAVTATDDLAAEAELTIASGNDSCGSDDIEGSGSVRSSERENLNPACTTSDELVFAISAGDEGAAGPIEIVVIEEPPVADPDGLPEAAGEPTWETLPLTGDPTAVAPADSFSGAPRIEPGFYSAAITPGEYQFFRVQVGWGQRLQAEVRFQPNGGAAADLVDGSAGITILGPTRADAGQSLFSQDGAPDATTNIANEAQPVAGASAAEVRVLNRTAVAGEDQAAAFAGDYYVFVALEPDEEGETYELGYTLVVDVLGEAQDSPYAPGDDIDVGDPPSDPETQAASDGGGSGDFPAALVAAGLAGLGLAALVGAAALRLTGRQPTTL